MDLAKLTINLRPRTPWEGIDLGFTLARHWFLQLWLLWLVGAIPIFLILNLLLPISLWLAGILAWWFKPLYEPPLLYWLSRVTFAEQPSVGEVRGQWWRILRNQLLANLTWRRLNPSRSFVMPVAVLEGLTGKPRLARIRVLSRQQHAAGWLTLLGLHFEIILELGLLILLVALLPEELRSFELREFLFEPTGWQQWLQQLTGLLAMSVIAPFYVAAGFGLYLTRRSQLEAWDIELGFRKLAKRLHNRRRVAGVMMGLCAAIAGLTLPDQPLQAAELSRAEAKSLIQSVMQEDDFGKRETQTSWKYIGQTEDENTQELHWLVEWLIEIVKGFTQGLAAIGEVLMWLALGGLIVYLAIWFLRNRGLFGRSAAKETRQRQGPVAMMGLDIRPESLPTDIAAEAVRLLRQGQQRQALSLLYRGSLSVLVHQYRLKVPGSATEGECLELARAVLGQQGMDYQAALTHAWCRLAYGHDQTDLQALEQLCNGWERVYGK
ncbi:MAG: hypothetical protein ABFS39_11490 [Pseudomonadota bacterium]